MQRNTVQRQIILNALKKSKSHPGVDEIYAEVHSEHPSVSKTTVYRNLRQLTQNGIIRQVSLPDGLERYDGNATPHYHFRCRNCGSVLDVDLEYSESINEIVRQKYGFQVDEHDIVFSGICPKCIKK
jgi:Fe2+/Zn2+ uptake regulation proteins